MGQGTLETVRTFTVLPVLPEELTPLQEIAKNLWWTWNPDAVDLFQRMDPELWDEVEHNPMVLLKKLPQTRLDNLAKDRAFLAHLKRTKEALDQYMADETWFTNHHGDLKGTRIAYFSAEFGIHESLPIYSGGLGILAGDHLKSASDLGLPLVGVGLFYHYGYCRQYLNSEGWQQEVYQENPPDQMPMDLVRNEEGNPVLVELDFPGRKVFAQSWKVQVGRVPLYLLDTNLERNQREDRWITGQLYGGDMDMRIRQEVVLGIGGIRLLKRLGLCPHTCHMNEGHSAFLALERTRNLMEEKNLSFHEAKEAVALGNVFTTHTPVPAGNDVFPPHLLEPYFKEYTGKLGLSWEDFLRLGRVHPEDQGENFCMTVLALRFAEHRNGVSKLHGAVSREMWKEIWPGLPENEVPITSITNGIHASTWVGKEMSALLTTYLGPDWFLPPFNPSTFMRVKRIPDAELWRTHERARERLVTFVRTRLAAQLKKRGVPSSEVRRAEEVLDPFALTIGFARRFADYKRGSLIFRDLERIRRILTDPERPVQLVFAGKAHPKNDTGKNYIKQIVQVGREAGLRTHVVFIEDYDANVARYLVQGVDLWLNNPRRPLEASGTSGMKVAANGGLNMSVLDGWWCEGYRPDLGWAIGRGETYDDPVYQDEVESRAIYDLLEQEVVPTFYERDRDGLPRGWIARMKASLASIVPFFETGRMVSQYAERFYFLGTRLWKEFSADGNKVRALGTWKEKVENLWAGVKIVKVETHNPPQLSIGSSLEVKALVHLGSLPPEDVGVEIYYGPVDAENKIKVGNCVPMSLADRKEEGLFLFEGRIPCSISGAHGYAVRILPRNPELGTRLVPGLITWG